MSHTGIKMPLIKWLLIALAASAGAVLLGFVPVNVTPLRGPIGDAVLDASGLSLSIDGPIVLRLGTRPTIRTGAIAVKNPEGSSLVELGELAAAADLMALFKGQVHILEVTARSVGIDYCVQLPANPGTTVSAEKTDEEKAGVQLAVDTFRLDRVAIYCGVDGTDGMFRLTLERAVGRAPLGGSLELEVVGRAIEQDFELSASAGSLDQLLGGPAPFPIHAVLSSDALSAQVAGELGRAPDGLQFDVAASLEADDPAGVARNYGLELPHLGRLRLDGRFLGGVAGLAVSGVSGELGETRYAFDAGIELSGEKPSAHLRLSVPQLDLTPMMGLGEEKTRDWKSLDLQPINDLIQTFDAKVEIQVARVIGAEFGIADIELRAALEEGRLEVPVLALNVLDGRARLSGSYDGRADCPELAFEAQAGALSLGTLDLLAAVEAGFEEAELSLSSCGATPGMHLDSLQLSMGARGAYIAGQAAGMPGATGRLAINVAPDQPVSLRWTEGQFDGQAFEVTAAVGSLGELLGPDAWPLMLQAHAFGADFQVEGEGGLATSSPRVDAVAKLRVPRVGSLHPLVDVYPNAGLSLSATVGLQFDRGRLSLDLSSLSLGRSRLRGTLDLNLESTDSPSMLAIQSDLLDLQEIAAIISEEGVPNRERQPAERRAETHNSPLRPSQLDVELKFRDIRTARLDFQDLEITARLHDKLVKNGRIGVRVEDELQLKGGLDLDMRDLPLSVVFDLTAHNADIGRLLERAGVDEPFPLQADRIELVIRTQGDDVGGLLANTRARASISNFLWQLPDPVEPEQSLDVSLPELDATLVPGKPSVWAAAGDIGDLPVRLRLTTASVLELMDESRDLPILLAISAGNDTALLDATVDRSSDDVLLASLSLSGARFDEFSVPLEGLETPLPDYQVRGDISLTESILAVEDLQLQLGSSTAKGSFSVSLEESRARYSVAFHSPHFQTDDLQYFSGTAPDDLEQREAVDRDRIETANPNEAAIRPAEGDRRGVAGRTGDFLNHFRQHNDLDIELAIDELFAGNKRLGGATLHLHAGEKELRLDPVTVNLPGGDVEAKYGWQISGERFSSELYVNTEAMRYGGLLPLIDPRWQMEGLAYLDIQLRADTDWTEGAVPLDLLMQHADGYIRAAVWPKDIEADVLDLWTANLVFALLPIGTVGKDHVLNCMVAHLDSSDGLMETNTTLLDSTRTVIRLRGKVDFAQRLLDLLVIPQAKREKFLSVSTPVRVTGPFDDFQIGVEAGGLIGVAIKWWMNLFYVPYKWLTGGRFPADGTATCFNAMGRKLTPELERYFDTRDFTLEPPAL
jgi:uncharacterized protein involved in outer membrane biogenesis